MHFKILKKLVNFIFISFFILSGTEVFAATTDATLTLDDNTADSPQVIMRDADEQDLTLQKLDTGEADIINTEGSINLKPSGDTNDYLYLSTASDLLGLFWEGVGAYTNDPAIRINSSGELEYRDEDSAAYTTFDSLSAGSTNFGDLSDVVLTGAAQGDVAYFNGTNWVNLSVGTSGQFLQTQGAGANPVWASTGGGNTLDQAYNAGSTIDVDTDAITLTVSDTDNNAVMALIQNDTTNNPAALTITNTGTGDSLQIDTNEFVVTGAGNVGIGTTSPDYTLTLGTNGGSDKKVKINSDSSGDLIELLSMGNYSSIYARGGHSLNFGSPDTNGRINFYSGNIVSVAMAIDSSGNVGIGTTSPSVPLHVVGQCVTGDTRLRRRRKRKRARGLDGDDDVGEGSKPSHDDMSNNDGDGLSNKRMGLEPVPTDDEYIYDTIRIDQIQPGDEIASLDEYTGKIVYSRVNALMDMGVKDIYELTTEFGKTIRTTGNHPYLVLNLGPQTDCFGRYNKKSFSRIAAFEENFEESQRAGNNRFSTHAVNINKDNAVGKKNGELSDVAKIFIKAQQKIAMFFGIFKNFFIRGGCKTNLFNSFESKSVLRQSPDKIMMNAMVGENNHQLGYVHSFRENFGRFFRKLCSKCDGSKDVFFGDRGILRRDFIYDIAGRDEVENISNRNASVTNARFSKSNFRIDNDSVHVQSIAEDDLVSSCSVTREQARWTSVAGIKEGQYIAVANESHPTWEKITKITHLPAEQVYDIEVEGTHNFVANDIIAHNTYITGNVGIGDVSPDHTLDVAGNIGMDASGYLNYGDTDGSTGYGFRDNAGNVEFKNSGGSWAAFGSSSGNTLDQAYNSGSTIDVDTDAVTLTVSDTDNNAVMALIQNDTTNNPAVMTIANAGTGDDMTVTNTDAGADGVTLTLHHDSVSPAAADVVATIDLEGDDSSGNVTTYAQITGLIQDPTSTSEDGELVFSAMKAGTLTEAMRIDESGYVGIGTASPGAKFNVEGQSAGIIIGEKSTSNGHRPSIVLNGYDNSARHSLTIGATYLAGNRTQQLLTNSNVQRFLIDTSAGNTNIILDPGTGNVGIGTASPSEKLELGASGRIQFNALGTNTAEFGYNGSSNFIFDINTNIYAGIIMAGNDPFSITGGNVGIGTVSPGSLLDVQAAAGSAGTATLSSAELTVVDGDVLGKLNFQAPLESDGTDAILVGASIWGEADDTFSATVNATELVFATGASETATEKVRIDSAGNVGIGTATPVASLDVATGTVHFGDVTSFEIPNSTGLTIDADGEMYLETDADAINIQAGSNTAGMIPSNTDVAIPLIQQKGITLLEPDQIVTVEDEIVVLTVDSYNYPNGIVVTAIRVATSEASSDTYNIESWDTPVVASATKTTIDAVTLSAASEATETTITSATVTAGSYIVIDLDDAQDNIASVHITIWFYVRD